VPVWAIAVVARLGRSMNATSQFHLLGRMRSTSWDGSECGNDT
jgi:hypothetical protein